MGGRAITPVGRSCIVERRAFSPVRINWPTQAWLWFEVPRLARDFGARLLACPEQLSNAKLSNGPRHRLNLSGEQHLTYFKDGCRDQTTIAGIAFLSAIAFSSTRNGAMLSKLQARFTSCVSIMHRQESWAICWRASATTPPSSSRSTV